MEEEIEEDKDLLFFSKVMNRKEFEKKCKEKGVQFTTTLWNRYVDKCWDQLEKELSS